VVITPSKRAAGRGLIANCKVDERRDPDQTATVNDISRGQSYVCTSDLDWPPAGIFRQQPSKGEGGPDQAATVNDISRRP
jgi:hypothetical protein